MRVSGVLSDFCSRIKITSFLIGYSGGLDSTVLLHAIATLREDFPKIKIRAIHINHQLQKKTNSWEKHCQKMCHLLKVPLVIQRVKIQKKRGESLEALARNARYAAIAKTIKPKECLLTAHHLGDQAETILLQLFRGAGLKGLSGMAVLHEKTIGHKKILHARPLLSLPRKILEEYAEKNKLKWVEDPSNTNMHFDRNFLRNKVLPLLETRFPNAKECIARSGTHAAEAQRVMNEFTKQDYSQVKTALPTPFGKAIANNEASVRGKHPERQQGGASTASKKRKAPGARATSGEQNDSKVMQMIITNVLDGKTLRTFSKPRQKNVLRYWLGSRGFSMPSEKKLDQILKTILESAWDRSPCVEWGDVEIRRYRQWLFALPKSGARKVPGASATARERNEQKKESTRSVSGGALANRVKLTKKQYQTLGVPPWWR